jgi:hypothetical protein
VVGSIDNDCTANNFTFQVASGAVGTIERYTGYMVGPLGEFLGDRADAVVVADQVWSMLRCGYVMTANAVVSDRQRSCRSETVNTPGAAGGVASGTVVADKVSVCQRKKRSKSGVMALNAPVSH